MKRMKKLYTTAIALVAVVGMAVSGFAATYSTPAEAAAGVTGKSLEDVIALRKDGKTFGTIASDAGKLTEFKAAIWEMKSDALEEMVKNGQLSREECDELLAIIKDHQANCTATGHGSACLNLGTGYGSGGYNAGNGGGHHGGGHHSGGGMRLRDGSCYY